jgi:Mg-chelatase subunit ChlD
MNAPAAGRRLALGAAAACLALAAPAAEAQGFLPLDHRAAVCAADPLYRAPGAAERAARRERYAALLGMLAELADQRESFHAGEPRDAFAALYYHVTRLEMERIAAGDFVHPVAKMDQMAAFYAAWKRNRDASGSLAAVEPHWRDYFSIRTTPGDEALYPVQLGRMLYAGVTAHVEHDLERAIRHVLRGPSARGADPAVLAAEFARTNTLFEQASLHGIAELQGHLVGRWPHWMLTFAQNGSRTSLIDDWARQYKLIGPRMRAWENAADPVRRQEIGAQPLLDPAPYRERGRRLCGSAPRATLFVFDVSGSMAGGRIASATRAGLAALDVAAAEPEGSRPSVSIHAFSGDCSPAASRTLLDFTTDIARARAVVRGQLGTGGGTPLPQALDRARADAAAFQARQRLSEPVEILVLSDGESTCGPIRPAGVYFVPILDDAPRSAGAPSAARQRFLTVGLELAAGSAAERDMQYLAGSTGGTYLPASTGTQLARAFQKHLRAYTPRPSPSLATLPASQRVRFYTGAELIRRRRFADAARWYESYAADHPGDAAGHFNHALALEAAERYAGAARAYGRYLQLAPTAADAAEIRRQLALLALDAAERQAHLRQVLRSDLEYLQRYYDRLFRQDNDRLAAELAGFVREKGPHYADLAGALELPEPWLTQLQRDLARSLDRLARRIDTPTFDRDAVSLLTVPIGHLEEIVARLPPPPTR